MLLLLFKPSTNVAPLAYEYFTGANGSSWGSQWTQRTGTALSGTALIQNNSGQLVTAATANFLGSRMDLTGMTTTSNTEITGSFIATSTGVNQYVQIQLGSDGGVFQDHWEATNSYIFQIQYQTTATSSSVALVRSNGGTLSTLSSLTKTVTGNVEYWFRFQRIGTTLNARIWQDGTTEPTTWDVTATAATTTAGIVGVAGGNGATSVARTFIFDDILVTNGATVAAPTGQIKVWNGTAWVAKPMKVWTGSAWVVKPVKYWNGSTWVRTPY